MRDPSIPARFAELLARIEPKKERLDLAARLPATLREELARSARLRTIEPRTLLVGSYRRRTAVDDIKDVDVAVLVAKDYASTSPKAVLDDLGHAVDDARRRKRLRNIERYDQRRSIRCQLPDDEFQIDLVPVVAVTGDPYGDLWIPDREQRRWLPTRSIGYLSVFSRLNASTGQRLVPLMKLVKHWKNQHGIDRFQAKSFWIEALIVGLVRTGEIVLDGSWPEITQQALRALYRRCLPVYNARRGTPIVPDPMIAGANVAHNWKRDGFEKFFVKLDSSYKAANRAVNASDGVAMAGWRSVFGHEFARKWTDEIPTAAACAGAVVGIAALSRHLLKPPN